MKDVLEELFNDRILSLNQLMQYIGLCTIDTLQFRYLLHLELRLILP